MLWVPSDLEVPAQGSSGLCYEVRLLREGLRRRWD